MTAYYNEYDPFAAATLRELIKDGLIAPGVVDERSIELVQPSDLKGFVQVHLFAGYGIWSAAARLAGWMDDRPLWSASTPCPPFSSAGKIKACSQCGGFKPIPHVRRTGFFLCSLCGHEWLADHRHLWPEVWRLVRDERPPCVVGEQVASADGRTWLDLVRASLEILAYDAWGVDTCAAGFGAPHIRQRLYWVADTANIGIGGDRGIVESPKGAGIREISGQGHRGPEPRHGGGPMRMADTNSAIPEQLEGARNAPGNQAEAGSRGEFDGCGNRVRLVDSERTRLEGLGGDGEDRDEPGRVRAHAIGSASSPSQSGGMADANGNGRREAGSDIGTARNDGIERNGPARIERSGPTNGLWRDVDWLGCTDGKWRPVEPGTFPLVNAGAFRNRVAELRGAGNAVNLAQAAGFIRAIMNELPGGIS